MSALSFVPLSQHLVEIVLTQDPAQRGLRQIGFHSWPETAEDFVKAFSPSAARNCWPIREVLTRVLPKKSNEHPALKQKGHWPVRPAPLPGKEDY